MKITESDVFITHVDVDKINSKKKESIGIEYQQNKLRYDKNGNIRIFNLAEKKKYMCFDADDKKSNDHVSSIMKKYGIKNNCYPSISNYFNHSEGENSHKYHYWFVTDKLITSHIHVNNTSLDVWGPNGRDTSHPWLQGNNKRDSGGSNNSDNDSKRTIFEPNVEGLYLDTNKKYPMLTDEIYNDVMNININKGIFSNKGQVPSCMFHNDCIAFERNKHADLKSKMNNNKDKDAITIVENKNKKSIPSSLFKNILEKKNKKYYQLKYKSYDNTLPLYNGIVYGSNKISHLDFLNPIEVWAKIVDVYDGDTFYAIFEMPQEPLRKYEIRLTTNGTNSIDAPEVNSKNHNEKTRAYACKKIVEDMILHKIVRLKLYGNDVYGRILADVYIHGDESSLSETLSQHKYYKKVNFFSYMGENKKISEPSELLEHVIRKKNIEFKRDGYSPMSSYFKKQLQDYLTKNPNAEPLELKYNSYGVICCVKTNNHNDPLIATVRMCNASNYLSLPKGHRENSESEVESAIRETREELGIDASKYIDPNLYTNIKYTIAYPMYDHEWKLHKEYPDESKRPFCVYYKEVTFFLAVFPETLELKPQPKEILECKWIPLSTFKKKTHADSSKTITDFFNSKNVKSKLYTVHASDSASTNTSLKNKKMLQAFFDKGFKTKNQDAIESKPKPQFNILDPFHLFNKKKSSESSKNEPLQVQNKNDEPAKVKKLFGFLKK